MSKNELPALILLPGMHGSSDLLRGLTIQAWNTMQVIPFAYPRDEFFNYHELTEKVLRRLPKDRPYVIAASSFSGPIAAKIAALEPPGLIGIVLIATFATNPGFPGSDNLFPIARFGMTRYPLHRRLAKMFFLNGHSDETLVDQFLRVVAGVKPTVMAARLQEVLGVDVQRELAAVKIPVHYVRASRDRLVTRRSWQTIQKICPDMQTTVVEGPHLISQANPAGVWQGIRGFLGMITK